MSDPKPLRIVKLEAANVKRLTAVEITPDGSLVVVGGKNGAGKTSVLDSIAMALGGKDLVPELPLRRGEKHGHVEVDLGDLVVRRTFTPAGGGTLTVSNREGAVYKSPQKILDQLVGRLSFDPLDFARMDPKAQRETLRALVGLDFSELDAKRLGLFEERTLVNRTTKALEARVAAMPVHEDAPAEPVSVEALVAELEAAAAAGRAADAHDRTVRALIAKADALNDEAVEFGRRMKDVEAKILSLKLEIEALETQAKARAEARQALMPQIEAAAETAKAARDALPDPAPIRERIASAEGINAKVRANAACLEQAAELAGSRAQAEKLTEAIEALDAAKAQALAGAAFPVPGLSFDESGVLLEGIPFAQASSAEQLRVSVAMGLAANPRLRVLLIRDGSLLDDESLELVAKMAAEAEAQVWLERVSSDGEGCQVVIEDGAVRAPEVTA